MMQDSPALLTALIVFGVLSCVSCEIPRYKAPDECDWTGELENGVALICKLQTINSELENTNFNVIQPHHTVKLKLECSETLFYQSSLTAASFKPLIELKELVIDYCKIGNLSNEAFKGLKELRHLAVRTHNTDWPNMALEISSKAFTGELVQLERLDLSYNNLWNLPKGSLCPLSNLEFLNLTRNQLREVGNFLFDHNSKCASNLKVLDLSNNIIESLPSIGFSGLVRLQFLDLSYNKIAFIADRAFEGLMALATVKLNSNHLSTLPPDLLNDFRDIKEIYLNNNSLSVLPPGLFGGLRQLTILDLSMNELKTEWINSVTFSGLIRLIVLDLSNNRITKVEPVIFRDLYSLQILSLQQNLIESLAENTFSSLSNLHTLLLSDNKLTTVDSTTFNGLYVLSLLSLDNNRINFLHPNSLKNASSLQDIYLNGNSLQQIPEALKATPLLKTLDLGENLIDSVPSEMFDHMIHLNGLRLIDNHISELKKGIFDKMKNLNVLNLSGNKIQYIQPGIFDENIKLQAIRLDNNRLTSVDGLFKKLSNLIWLNVSSNKLKTFDYSMIPANLQWLDISTNEITELGNYYEIESQLVLNSLDASVNKLTEITGNAIPASIEVLDLHDNLISKVQSYAFLQKPNLTRVDLKGNRINRIEPHAFRITAVPQDKPLPEFYIGDNRYLCDCTMEWLQHVNDNNQNRIQPRIMDLASIYCELLYDIKRIYIPLIEASRSQFLCKYDSHCFALCHCCDFDACDCEMTCPFNCTCYHDQTWTSNIVDCAVSGYSGKLPNQIPMDVTRLHLDGNDFQIITSHAFIGRKKLKILFLNASNIEILQNRSFNGLKNLEDLYLQDNKLQELTGNEFIELDNLKNLNLERNFLTLISKQAFSNLPSLMTLNLHSNRLTNVLVWQLPVNVQVTLAGNPWSCNCKYIKEYRQWIADMYMHVLDADELRCIFNANETSALDKNHDSDQVNITNDGYSFSLMTGKGFEINATICMDLESIERGLTGNFTKKLVRRKNIEDYLFFSIATLVTVLVFLLCCTTCFFYRNKLQMWCYSRFSIRSFCRQTYFDKNDRDKLFDAFVSYSLRDEVFVLEELAPILENGNSSYKLCLHYRDFPEEGLISDTILQAIDSSRRTILILSKNFIKTEWCHFDFKSAYHQMLCTRPRKLIVILIGDMQQQKLDPDIRYYLKANTYLCWNDKFFWEKLKCMLPNGSRKKQNSAPSVIQPQLINQVLVRSGRATRTVRI